MLQIEKKKVFKREAPCPRFDEVMTVCYDLEEEIRRRCHLRLGSHDCLWRWVTGIWVRISLVIVDFC